MSEENDPNLEEFRSLLLDFLADPEGTCPYWQQFAAELVRIIDLEGEVSPTHKPCGKCPTCQESED